MPTLLCSAGTTSTSPAYSSGDVMGDSFLIQFPGVPFNDAVRINSVALYWTSLSTIVAHELHLFASSISEAADNAAHALSDADAAKFRAWVNIPTTSMFNATNNVYAGVSNLNLIVPTTGGALYGLVIIRGNASVSTTTDLTVRFDYSYPH